VILDAHPKEFIGVKLQQTVFLTGLDKYIGAICIVQKKGFRKGPSPFNSIVSRAFDILWNAHINLFRFALPRTFFM